MRDDRGQPWEPGRLQRPGGSRGACELLWMLVAASPRLLSLCCPGKPCQGTPSAGALGLRGRGSRPSILHQDQAKPTPAGDPDSRPGAGTQETFLKKIFIYSSLPGLSCSMPALSCDMLDLVPRPGIEPRPPALGARSLSHWTTREVPGRHFHKAHWRCQRGCAGPVLSGTGVAWSNAPCATRQIPERSVCCSE